MSKLRKISSIAMVAITILSSFVSGIDVADAQSSPTITGVVTEIIEATDPDGDDVNLGIRDVTDKNKDIVDKMKDPDYVREAVGDRYDDDYHVIDMKEVFITGNEDLIKWPVDVVFKSDVVASGDSVIVVYFDGVSWRYVESNAGDGIISANISETGVFAFLLKKNNPPTSTPTPTPNGNPGGKPAKTGDNVSLGLLIGLLAVSVIGMVVVLIKKKENR